MYSYQQAREATLKYFNGSEFLSDIWLSKYCLKDREGNYLELTPEERFKTIAKEIARIERSFDGKKFKEQDFYELMQDFKYFIPGGSILFGVGNNHYLTSLGNCFVVGSKIDSYGSICMIDQEQVQLMKRRGGVGHDLSHLRPRHSKVNGCASTSTGAFSFMNRYSSSTQEVAQGGRRGALMLSAHINHPDIETFVESKDDLTKITGANISVKITDEFMENVINDKDHLFRFPIDSQEIHSSKPAKDIWKKIIHQAWKSAEPGVLFWTRVLEESPADCYSGFKTSSTNPCGEIPLCPYDSCRLSHHNLFSYVNNPFTKDASFDYEKYRKNIILVTRFMDNIIELEREKIDAIIKTIDNSYEDESVSQVERNLWIKVKNQLIKGRRCGIGVLGVADTLAAMGIEYGSEEGNNFIVDLQVILAKETYKESIHLAKERGSFPIWSFDQEEFNPFVNRVIKNLAKDSIVDDYVKYGRRNIGCLTIAPTGTTSLFGNKVGVSSGIEPVFELFYQRRRKINDDDGRVDMIDSDGNKWQWYYVIHPPFKMWYDMQGYSKPIESLTKEELEEVSKESPWHGCTASTIDVISKIHLQGRLQKWVDHSISVTHNLPQSTSEEEVDSYYKEAWKSGCKGITIFREGSRQGVLVKERESNNTFEYIDAQKRPEVLDCEVHSLVALREKWFVIIGLLNDKPYEIFAIKEDKIPQLKNEKMLRGKIIKRKKRLYDLSVARSYGAMTIINDIVSLMDNDDDRTNTKRFSLDLRHHINPKFIVETIDSQPKDITSFDKAISRVLKKYIPDGEKSNNKCPNCKEDQMIYVGGCNLCKNCGYSSCG